MADYIKHRAGAPAGFFAAEAAGLRWLAEPGVVPVVAVRSVTADALHLENLHSVRPTADAARTFGARLAALHDAGAPAFGWTPSATAWFGPLDAPFAVPTTARDTFAQYWGGDRLGAVAELAAPTLRARDRPLIDAAVSAVRDGAFDGIAGEGVEKPARVHGDLWSGNLLWTDAGGTLIDPAAHGGHRLEDLALLALFGAPLLDDIFAGYERAHPMPASWREDLPAHLFFALLAHVHIFGAAYVERTLDVARAITRRADVLAG